MQKLAKEEIEKILKYSINLTNTWVNDDTNSYAYMLGLDMSKRTLESTLGLKRYTPGMIAASLLDIPKSKVYAAKIDSRVLLDLKALNYIYVLSSERDIDKLSFRKNSGFSFTSYNGLVLCKEEKREDVYSYARVNKDGLIYTKDEYGPVNEIKLSDIKSNGYSIKKVYRIYRNVER